MVTNDLIQHYMRFTSEDLGMIIVEHAYIHKSGQLSCGQLAVDRDECVEGLRDWSTQYTVLADVWGCRSLMPARQPKKRLRASSRQVLLR